MVNNLKKVAEEVKTEAVEDEEVKIEEEVVKKIVVNETFEKAVTKEQQIGEEVRKEEGEVKNENLEADNAGDEVGVEEKKNDAEMKQTEAAKNTEVPITEVLLKKTECQPKENRSSLARKEEAANPCDG
ncbi:uncharacterized protein LOC110935376 [Helianthus annuus]|uniref:uncharacterized protein LOC110935376 n=1 Tax=Helianthus annuus TaxID=4232 RepID=UPI000B905AF3|nr:uncharacterized protein LOC110935376 [Helianthus annuus]